MPKWDDMTQEEREQWSKELLQKKITNRTKGVYKEISIKVLISPGPWLADEDTMDKIDEALDNVDDVSDPDSYPKEIEGYKVTVEVEEI